MNITLLKLQLLNEFLAESQKHQQILLDELIDNATDPVIKKRRFRMLSNLAVFESTVIKKIHEFDTDDVGDFLNFNQFKFDLELLVDRSA